MLAAGDGWRNWTGNTTDENQTLGIACDLEYEATKMLKIYDEPDYWSAPYNFQIALKRAFQRGTADAIAAE